MSSDLELRIAQALARSSNLSASVSSSLSSGRFKGEDGDDTSVDASSEINNAEAASQFEDMNSMDEKKESMDVQLGQKALLSNLVRNTSPRPIITPSVLPRPPSSRLLRATTSYAASLNARRAQQLENEALDSDAKAARQREQAWCSIIPSPSGPTDEAPPLLATRSRRIVDRREPPPSSLIQKPVLRNAPTTTPTISMQSRLLAPKAESAPPPLLPPAKYTPGVGHSREWISVADLSLQTRVPKESRVSAPSRPRARSASVSGRSRSNSNISGSAGGGDIAERLFYWAFETQKKRDERMNQAPDGCTFRPSLSRNALAKKLSELPVPYLPETLIVGTSSSASQNYNDPTLSGRSSQSAGVALPQKLLARHELLYASAVAREGRRRAREWAAYEGNPNFSFHPQIDRNTNALASSRFNTGSAMIARGTIDSMPSSSDILTMNPSAENSIVGDEVDVGHRQEVSERLYLEAEEIEARRQIAADLELRRVASFHPKLNAKSLAMVSGSQRPRSRSLSVSSDGPRGGGIFRKPLTYVDPETTAEALALRKIRDELAQCTFAPLLVSQSTKIRGRSSSSSLSSLKRDKPASIKGEPSEPAFERLTRLGELSQERLEQKRLEKVEKELVGSTFSPQINKNAESLMKQRLLNTERGEPSSVETRLISEQRILEERLNHRRAELAMLELASCSFSPAILPASKRIAEAATKNGSARRSIGKSIVRTDDGMYATPKITPSVLRSSPSGSLSSPALPAVSLTFSSSTAPRTLNHEDHSEIEVDTTRESSLHPPANVSRAVWERLIDTAREFEHIRARVLQTVTRRALSALPLSLPAGPVKREVEKGCQELHRILIASRPHVPKSPETSPRAQTATRTRENGLVARESLPTGLRASRLILWDRLTEAMTSPAEQKCLRDDLTRLIESRTSPFLVRTLRPGSFSLTVVETVAVENHRSFISELKSPLAPSSSSSPPPLSATAIAISAAESAGAAWATFALDAKKLEQVLNETSDRVATAIALGIDGRSTTKKRNFMSSEGEVVVDLEYKVDNEETLQKQQIPLNQQQRPIDTPETANWSTMSRVIGSSGEEGFETARSNVVYSPKVKQALGL